MYSLSVGAIFRNESDSIVEWIKHYLHHGVEHFYLINDNSDDDTVSKIKDYVDNGIITLYNVKVEYYLGRQRDLYNHCILPHLQRKETKWLLMIDLDEYAWSSMGINMANILDAGCKGYGQVQMTQYTYGSNGHITQPPSIVQSFTKRANESTMCFKYFVNSDYEFTSLNIHHADFADSKYITDRSAFMIVDKNWFVYNHYSCQSLEFWKTVKCTRGDGDAYLQRTMEDFHRLDINEVEDLYLMYQNKDI